MEVESDQVNGTSDGLGVTVDEALEGQLIQIQQALYHQQVRLRMMGERLERIFASSDSLKPKTKPADLSDSEVVMTVFHDVEENVKLQAKVISKISGLVFKYRWSCGGGLHHVTPQHGETSQPSTKSSEMTYASDPHTLSKPVDYPEEKRSKKVSNREFDFNQNIRPKHSPQNNKTENGHNGGIRSTSPQNKSSTITIEPQSPPIDSSWAQDDSHRNLPSPIQQLRREPISRTFPQSESVAHSSSSTAESPDAQSKTSRSSAQSSTTSQSSRSPEETEDCHHTNGHSQNNKPFQKRVAPAPIRPKDHRAYTDAPNEYSPRKYPGYPRDQGQQRYRRQNWPDWGRPNNHQNDLRDPKYSYDRRDSRRNRFEESYDRSNQYSSSTRDSKNSHRESTAGRSPSEERDNRIAPSSNNGNTERSHYSTPYFRNNPDESVRSGGGSQENERKRPREPQHNRIDRRPQKRPKEDEKSDTDDEDRTESQKASAETRKSHEKQITSPDRETEAEEFSESVSNTNIKKS